jgi:1,2-dihydroxy-3-keto-5-methylthiopentene dioxygenase
MARIIYPDHREVRELSRITAELARLGIALRHWPLPQHRDVRTLLAQASLNDQEMGEVLHAVEHRFEELSREAGYAARDLIVIHEGIPGLRTMLSKFEAIHYHTDDEVRYVLAGKGYFGLVDGAGRQVLLEVGAGDYVNVPANTEHWFTLGDSRRIKAVRYFIDTSGWAPVYTNREVTVSVPAD